MGTMAMRNEILSKTEFIMQFFANIFDKGKFGLAYSRDYSYYALGIPNGVFMVMILIVVILALSKVGFWNVLGKMLKYTIIGFLTINIVLLIDKTPAMWIIASLSAYPYVEFIGSKYGLDLPKIKHIIKNQFDSMVLFFFISSMFIPMIGILNSIIIMSLFLYRKINKEFIPFGRLAEGINKKEKKKFESEDIFDLDLERISKRRINK